MSCSFFFSSLKRLLIGAKLRRGVMKRVTGEGEGEGVKKVLAAHYLARISKSGLMEAVCHAARVAGAVIKEFHSTLVDKTRPEC